MTVKRFSGSFKSRTDILDNITPNNVVQPNVSVPAGEWKPCNWLPVIWQGEASQDNFVISSGKVVCMTRTGRLCSARYRWLGENGAAADVALTYTALDVEQGTINITTGAPVTTGDVAGGAVTMAEFAEAIVSRGLVLEAEVVGGGVFDPATDAHARAAMLAFVSAPVGVAAYDVYAWAGDAPGELNFVNYQKQHLIQFFTDVQLQVPVHVQHEDLAGGVGGAEEQLTAAKGDQADWSGGGALAVDGTTFPDASKAPAPLLLTSDQLAGLARYSAAISAGDNLVGIQLTAYPVASNTSRTPVEDGGDALVRQKSKVSKVSKAGDFFLDGEVGIIIAFDDQAGGGGTAPHAAAVFGSDITFYAYGNESDGAAAGERYIHFAGRPRAGCHVTYDLQGNFTSIEVDASTDMDRVIGRCLGVVQQPKGLLDRTRTAFAGSSFDKTAQMPGTATEGFSDLITLTDEVAADLVALINVKVQ